MLFILTVVSALTACTKYIPLLYLQESVCCNNPLFQSLLSESLSAQRKACQRCVRSSVWMFAAHPALLTDFFPKDDLLNRPHTNLFRSLSSFPSAFFGSRLPEGEQGSWYRPHVVYWSSCWVTQGIMVRLLVIDFQRARSHFPTMDVIIYSATVSSRAFIFLDSCQCFLCRCSTFNS